LRNSRISSRKGLVMESDFKNMIMIAVIVNIACYSPTSQARVFYFRTALQQRPWCPLVT
jgi:hypothetical protein